MMCVKGLSEKQTHKCFDFVKHTTPSLKVLLTLQQRNFLRFTTFPCIVFLHEKAVIPNFIVAGVLKCKAEKKNWDLQWLFQFFQIGMKNFD